MLQYARLAVVLLSAACGHAAAQVCAETEIGVLYWGAPVSSPAALTLAACCAACESDSTCTGYSFWSAKSWCYLSHGKDIVKSSNSDYTSGLFFRPTPTDATTDAPTDAPTNTPTEEPVVEAGGNCGSDKDGASACADGSYCQQWNPWYYQCIVVPANCATQEIDVDYYGNDLKTVKDVTPEECCDLCVITNACTAYTFVNYNDDGHAACYLKKVAGSKKTLKGAVSAVVTGNKPTCPTKVGEMCGDASGHVCCPSGAYCQPWNQWYYQCIAKPAQCSNQKTDVDYYGNELAVKYGLSPDKCCDECAKTSGCVAYTFVNQNPNGITACYLKSSTAGETHKVGCVSGTVNA